MGPWDRSDPLNEKQTMKRKGFSASAQLKQVMADYFYDLDRSSKSPKEKVAWCSSVGPAELLRSLDFHVFFPENHAAMLGATRMATELIPYANAIGYSPDICSYLTSDIGSFLKGTTPLTRSYPGIEAVPSPDVLVFNTNQCRDVQDWFGWYTRRFDVPMYGVNTPTGIGEVTGNHVDSIASQIEDMIEPLERIAGREFEKKRLREVVALSRECSDLWRKVLDSASARPSPITFFDSTIHMGPAVVLRGTREAVEYYRMLFQELEERTEARLGAVENERFRLYWEGMPIWGRLRAHSDFFANHGVCVTASTYCNSWIFGAFDPSDPIRSMARAYTELFIVRSDGYKEDYIRNMVKFFGLDGIIFHDSRTCRNNTNSLYGMPRRLEEDTGIPTLVVNGDLNDLRCLSDEQIRTNFEAFIEQLEEK